MARRTVPLESGERDRYVTVQQLTESAGSSHFPVETWTELCRMFMSKIDVGGRERLAADQLSAPYTTRWEANYRPDIDPDLVDVVKQRRLVYQGRVYDITSASMIGRNEGVEFLTLANPGVTA